MCSGIQGLTITMSPVREFARSVTEEWPSASGGWPLGLLAGLLPLQAKTQVDPEGKRRGHELRNLTRLRKERMSVHTGRESNLHLSGA